MNAHPTPRPVPQEPAAASGAFAPRVPRRPASGGPEVGALPGGAAAAWADTLPACYRSEAFAEDLAGLDTLARPLAA
jgi:hypothetical protein